MFLNTQPSAVIQHYINPDFISEQLTQASHKVGLGISIDGEMLKLTFNVVFKKRDSIDVVLATFQIEKLSEFTAIDKSEDRYHITFYVEMFSDEVWELLKTTTPKYMLQIELPLINEIQKENIVSAVSLALTKSGYYL
nr:hypothetical protein [uncultured Mucilaginibacter sp.]